ncbi:unnamed protein product [Blepharisma stoltei]|uniref:TFIIF beta subunit HTH domain-containing protein n=1 Tax=Blepharisma stoltei TaxID=1481888 RepID=A0AAU9JBW5_9CILI|nr:unnamed protein product [Blepharisma stoltei]
MDQIFTEKNHVMLLKLPDYLYEAFKVKSDSNMTISLDSKTMDAELSLQDDLGALTNGVTKFNTKVQKIHDDDLYIFSVDGNRKAILKAKVICRGNLLPEQNPLLYKHNQEKLEEVSKYAISTADPNIDDMKAKQRIFKLHEDHKTFVMANKDKAALATYLKKHKEKRVREEPEAVKEMLFNLFAIQRFWKVKNLVEETGQPEAYLRKLLPEIAEKGTQGAYRHQWQLRAEFRENEDQNEDKPTKKQKI